MLILLISIAIPGLAYIVGLTMEEWDNGA